MAKEKLMVTYTCEICGDTFEVAQGSRRRYCDRCMAKKISEGPTRRKRKVNEDS